MDNLFISQIASLEGPQNELDQLGKASTQNEQNMGRNVEIFRSALDQSLKEVKGLLKSEKKDLKDHQDHEEEEE